MAAGADNAHRVFLVSLDGMSWQALQHDPATAPLKVLREMLQRGAHAEGMTAHFPSTTSNSHAALWTGAWGDVNGITTNSMPIAPRAAHTAFERLSGFYGTGLRAEPVWLTAARQGVPTVSFEATQSHPFLPDVVGTDPNVPLTIVNGYQTRQMAPELFLHRKDVKDERCEGAMPMSRRAPLCFAWQAGPVTMHGVLFARGSGYDAMAVSASGRTVTAQLAATESTSPEKRPLARFVSPGLYLASVPDSSPAVVYFRLFEATADGSDFFLYQTAIRELAVFRGGKADAAAVEEMLRATGGFLANGPSHPLNDPPFELGTPLWKGGNGTAERRYLEIAELLIRQDIVRAQWLVSRYQPRFFVGYLPQPDEFDHSWKGLASDPRYAPLRALGYALVNRGIAAFRQLAGPRDDLLFTSDHGMTGIDHYVRINAALEQAGLLRFDAQGKIDGAHTQAVHLNNCVLLNTADWKGGIVPLSDRAAVLAKAEAALAAVRDAETGRAPITHFYDSAADKARFGIGGENGADFCFDFAPGYTSSDAAGKELVFRPEPARGVHGLAPERPEMQAILIGEGPGLPRGAAWTGVRSIDLAPLVAHLLGIQPPKQATGKSPLP